MATPIRKAASRSWNAAFLGYARAPLSDCASYPKSDDRFGV